MTDVKTGLKVEHVYRVTGRSMQVGRSRRPEEVFEALRYVGTMVPYRNGLADVNDQTEVFYWFANRYFVLFKGGTFTAEEMLT